jgi:hypothetical protein
LTFKYFDLERTWLVLFQKREIPKYIWYLRFYYKPQHWKPT